MTDSYAPIVFSTNVPFDEFAQTTFVMGTRQHVSLGSRSGRWEDANAIGRRLEPIEKIGDCPIGGRNGAR